MGFDAYLIRRLVDQKVVYCGMTCRGIHKRWTAHKHAATAGRRYKLSNAIRKYGIHTFSIEHVASAKDFTNLKLLETQLIEQYATFGSCGYNMTLGGDGVLGIRLSAASIEAMRLKNTGRKWSEPQRAALRAVRASMVHPMLGKKHTEAALIKIRQNIPPKNGEINPFYGKKHTEATLTKMTGKNNHRFGVRLSDEEKANLSGANNARYGTKHTSETLAKMSAKQRGPNNPNYGNQWSAERRAKQEAAYARRRLAKQKQ